mgnify:CR=1 FL=1
MKLTKKPSSGDTADCQPVAGALDRRAFLKHTGLTAGGVAAIGALATLVYWGLQVFGGRD